MTDRILSHLPQNEQAFESNLPTFQPSNLPTLSDHDDPEYWKLRLDNDAWLARRRWWWKHYYAGTLQSDRQRAAHELAAEGEAKAAELIRQHFGYAAHPTTYKCPFDLWVSDSTGRACRVEVKTSLYKTCTDPHKGGRYEANIRQNKDTDLVIFLAKNGTWWPYIIPITAIEQRHNIAIWSYIPGNYKGRWAIYLNAWQHLEQIIKNCQPRSWQLSLPMGGVR